jgi:peptidoglycan/xylan/chitin deacetylase (PgdA/CDA1 family)
MPVRRAAANPYGSRTFLADALAWVLFLTLGVGGFFAWRFWSHRAVLEASDVGAGVPNPRIAVLSYDRVVESPDGRHMDQARLRRQLEALQREGFRPVTLRTLARFYRGEGTLPAKSLLLTFEHGYLSTASAADPVLREARWPAVLFVMTERQERKDPFFVYWPLLTRMVDSGVWEIGSHGHRGHSPVMVDAAGGEGAFFVRRAWLPAEAREETWQEFAVRLLEDHRRARSILQEHLQREVLAYAPPLKDVAVATLDPELHRTYEETVSALYPLAFIDDLFGINDRTSHPLHLKRLRVAPYWTTEELVARLRHGFGEPATESTDDEMMRRLWVPASGSVQLVGHELTASGPSRADLWRAGSQWDEDWVLEAELQIDSGQFWVVQQSADLSEEWRWGGDERGTHVQRRRPAQPVETLESFSTGIEPGRRHRLKVVRRGVGLWVELDGRPVAERPSYLPDRWRGNVGLVTWGGGQSAKLRLTSLRFAAFPYRSRPLSAQPTAAEVQAAIREAASLAAVSPRWLTAAGGGLLEQPLDRDLLAILARRYGWQVVPTVTVRRDAAPTVAAWFPEALARAKAQGWGGLRLDVDDLAPGDRQRVLAVAEGGDAARQGLRVLMDARNPAASTRIARASGPWRGAALEEGRP